MYPNQPCASGGEKSNVSTMKVNGISVGVGANMTENRADEDSSVATNSCWNITWTTIIAEEMLN